MEALLGRLRQYRPDQFVALRRQHFQALRTQLEGRFQEVRKERRARFARLAEMLRVLAPAATLARGYSMTMKADGTMLGSAADVRPGMRLVTRVADGEVKSKVV